MDYFVHRTKFNEVHIYLNGEGFYEIDTKCYIPIWTYFHEDVIKFNLTQSKMKTTIFHMEGSCQSSVLHESIENSVLIFFKDFGCPIKKHPKKGFFVIDEDVMFSLKLRGNIEKGKLILKI